MARGRVSSGRARRGEEEHSWASWARSWFGTRGARVLDTLDPSTLLQVSTATGEPHTILAFLLRVAHHWAVHTGQIVYVAKSLREGVFDELWHRTVR